MDISSNIAQLEHVLPNRLLILPVYGRPIFPGIVTPISVTNKKMAQYIIDHLSDSNYIGCVMVKDNDAEPPTSKDLYETGTVVKIGKSVNLPEGGANFLVHCIRRVVIKKIMEEDEEKIIAAVIYPAEEEINEDDMELQALTRTIVQNLRSLASGNQMLTEQIKMTMANVSDPSQLADFACYILNLKPEELQDILETLDVKERLRKAITYLDNELQVLEIQKTINKQINDKVEGRQREFFLREQLKAIQKELGIDESPQQKDYTTFKEKLDALELSEDVKEKLYAELEKMKYIDPHASEYAVIRNYMELVVSLPWNTTTQDNLDLQRAEKILNEDHYGLTDVKERILEFLAVRKLKKDTKGSIICLVGPPGVGKTSLGKSIARALDRYFYRFSLGGMRDEAEIKGHRRTYVGAMPGKIIAALKFTKSANPVIMLDEIDKLGASFQGDPASALLEVLDPEQNEHFVDHYLDVPFDLSQVLFITTANTLDSIPRVLLDRMEVLRLSGYLDEEKYQIAKKYIIPKQAERHGIKKNWVRLNKQAILYIINYYAREAGLRNFERQIERINRKIATLVTRDQELPKEITPEIIRSYLGPENYPADELKKNSNPGMVHGLAWTPLGGSTLNIECIALPGKEHFKLTGQLGDVMTESASIAYSYIRSLIGNYEITQEFFEKNILHLHVPAGATPKDGPSAGITMATAILSLALKKKVPNTIGMTGELTLTGLVLPVGGIKEKMLAAHRAKLKTLFLPKENEKDLEELPDNVRKPLTFHLVSRVEEVFEKIFK